MGLTSRLMENAHDISRDYKRDNACPDSSTTETRLNELLSTRSDTPDSQLQDRT